MKAMLLACTLLAAASLQTTHAESTGVRIGPRIGPGEIRIDASEPVSQQIVDRSVEEDAFTVGGTLEYRAPFGLVIEAGHTTSGASDWWDDEGLIMTDAFGSIGWQIELGNGFALLPRVGRTRWKLERDEDWFDDDDELNPTIRGYENYWEITGLKRLNDVITFGVSHRDVDYEFGRARTTVFTVMFAL